METVVCIFNDCRIFLALMYFNSRRSSRLGLIALLLLALLVPKSLRAQSP